MKVFLTADDYGLEPANDRAIERLVADGRLDGVAVCTHLGADLESASRLLARGVALGPHLTLVAERPRAGGLGRAGSLPPSWRAFLAWFVAGRIGVSALRREIHAQLDAYERAGLPLDFLNGHQHLHLFPPVARVVSEALRRRAPGAHVRRVRFADARGPKEIALSVSGHAAAFGGPFLSARELGASGAMDAAAVTRALEAAPQDDIVELVFHPGAAPELASPSHRAWGYRWHEESALLASGEVDRAVRTAGARRVHLRG